MFTRRRHKESKALVYFFNFIIVCHLLVSTVSKFLSDMMIMILAFSSLARTVGKGLTTRSPAAFFLSFFFFSSSRSAYAHQFHLLGQDQSTDTQRAETTVASCHELRVSSFT